MFVIGLGHLLNELVKCWNYLWSTWRSIQYPGVNFWSEMHNARVKIQKWRPIIFSFCILGQFWLLLDRTAEERQETWGVESTGRHATNGCKVIFKVLQQLFSIKLKINEFSESISTKFLHFFLKSVSSRATQDKNTTQVPFSEIFTSCQRPSDYCSLLRYEKRTSTFYFTLCWVSLRAFLMRRNIFVQPQLMWINTKFVFFFFLTEEMLIFVHINL